MTWSPVDPSYPVQGAERLPNMTDVVDTIVSEAISRHKVAADNTFDIEVRTDAQRLRRLLGG